MGWQVAPCLGARHPRGVFAARRDRARAWSFEPALCRQNSKPRVLVPEWQQGKEAATRGAVQKRRLDEDFGARKIRECVKDGNGKHSWRRHTCCDVSILRFDDTGGTGNETLRKSSAWHDAPEKHRKNYIAKPETPRKRNARRILGHGSTTGPNAARLLRRRTALYVQLVWLVHISRLSRPNFTNHESAPST